MYLGKIIIGKNSSVGLKAHVAAGSILPEDTFIGANSSSYEMDDGDNVDRSRSLPPQPHILLKIFCIIPIQIMVLFISSLPWMGGLFGIVSGETKQDTDSVRTVITWWATPRRIVFHYLAESLNVSVRPFIWFGLVVIIKKIVDVICGAGKPASTDERTQKDNFRTYLLSALVPNGSLKSITKLFGTHYEFTSLAIRAMGGKVGRRVYWPGTGPSIQDFDLITVGDDVVFGSRSHITTSDSFGSEVVRIGNRAMIADRVVLSPGAIIGENTVLGSGAFINRNQNCAPNSVWVGNRKGSAVCLSNSSTSNQTPTLHVSGDRDYSEKSSINKVTSSDFGGSQRTSIIDSPHSPGGSPKSPDSEKHDIFAKSLDGEISTASNLTLGSSGNSTTSVPSSSTPFGRAFYEGKAPYYVIGQVPIFLYSTFITLFVQLYWNVGTISTIMLSRVMNDTDQLHPHWYRPLKIYSMHVALLSGLYTSFSLLALTIVIAAKWLLLGRRKPGNYDWDTSSYCQRWQLFLTIEALRRRSFSGNGVIGMLTGTHFCVLYFRALGARIGRDCALFAGGTPSLVFTEPDLLTLGDRVTIDDSSLVCHINTRGRFSLNLLQVGSRSVLRSGSRLLSGATMGEDAALLEHTLIMAGDVADDGVTYQGWPADIFRGNRIKICSSRSSSNR
jgi:acetyltransferase-like isoleucine patch superfamily enzyme